MAAPIAVTDYSELKDAILDHDGSIVGYVSSVPDLVNLMNEYEKRTGATFNVVYSRSSFGQTDIRSSKKHSVQWDTSENPKGPSIAYCGVPFLVLDTLRLECHFGRDRSRARKDRRLKLAEETESGQARRSRAIPASVKMSCPATIICVEIVYFPEFEIDEDSKSRRTAASRLLRNALAEDVASESIDRRIYLRLPAASGHSDHPRGEKAATTLQLDKRIAAFIRDQVVRGESDIGVVEKLVRHFVTNKIPEAWSAGPHNRRYYPKRKIITEHMYRERQRLQSMKVDQDELLGEMEHWTTDGDSVFFRPAGGDRRLLLVHQTKWQQRLLNLYGNDVCLLDAVFRSMKYALPMFFIAVRTNVNYAVVATFLVHNDDSSSIMEALDVVKGWNILWRPSFFFVDWYKAERKAITKSFADTAVFLGDFHRDQAWKKWLNSASNDIHDHHPDLLEMMNCIAFSVTPAAYEENVLCLQSSTAWISSQALQDWFSTEWISQCEQWVWCFRPGLLNMQIRLTDSIDDELKSLRHNSLVGLTDTSLAVVLAAVRQFLLNNYKRYVALNMNASELAKNYPENLPDYLRSRTPDFVRHCQDRLAASILDVSDIQLISAGNYAVYSATLGATYLVNFVKGSEMPTCHCLDWAQTLWPCKHMLAVLDTYNCWNAIPDSYLASAIFAIDETCNDQCEFSSIDVIDVRDVTDDEHLAEIIDFEGHQTSAASSKSDNVLVVETKAVQSKDCTANQCRQLLRSLNGFTFVNLSAHVMNSLHDGLSQLLNEVRNSVPSSQSPPPRLVRIIPPRSTNLKTTPVSFCSWIKRRKTHLKQQRLQLVLQMPSHRKRKAGSHSIESFRKRVKVENNRSFDIDESDCTGALGASDDDV